MGVGVVVVVDLLVSVVGMMTIEVVWVVEVVEKRGVAARRAAGVRDRFGS